MDDKTLQELLKAIASNTQSQSETVAAIKELVGDKTKAPASAMGAPGTFIPGGIFSVAGTDKIVFSSFITPRGILGSLPLFPGNEESPRFATLTGFTGTSGARPTNPCDAAPAGYMKGCYLTARFGRTSQQTQTIEWDQVKRKANRGIFDDLVHYGAILGDPSLVPSGLDMSQIMNVVSMGEMAQVAVNIERDLIYQTWQGVIGNDTAGGGYKEFIGLDSLITTGHVDAETNQACNSLDSDVKDFNYSAVDSTAPSIVEYVSMVAMYLMHNAIRMGFDPVTWDLCMRPELWNELTAVWPCQYNTNKCSSAMIGTGSQLVVMGNEMVAQRDAMRNGLYLDINGRRYNVQLDDGIFEHNSTNNANLVPGQFASSIYFVPKRVNGNMPVCYREYVDYRAGDMDRNLVLPGNPHFWTDNGIFSWALDNELWCFTAQAKTEQRIILRTPQLAGRIDHVVYEPLQHLRSYDPDSPYHYDGGLSARSKLTSYSVWDGTQR